MPYYHKCKNCAVDAATCARRSLIKSAIRGLGVTSIKFRCPDRTPIFRVGQRVEFEWTHYDESDRGYYGECEPDVLVFTGTVSSENEAKGTFVVVVDQSPSRSRLEPETAYMPSQVFRNGGFAVRVRPQDMRGLDEPDRAMCHDCLQYDVGSRCMKNEYYRPSKSALCMGKGA